MPIIFYTTTTLIEGMLEAFIYNILNRKINSIFRGGGGTEEWS